MIDPFVELIQQLGKTLDIELEPDKNNRVALKIHHRILIQLQEDREKQQMLIVALLSELPPGRFRENVFAEALKTNALPEPRAGTLGYLALKNSLTLHKAYPYFFLNGKKLALLLSNFIEVAESWAKAIERGQLGSELKK